MSNSLRFSIALLAAMAMLYCTHSVLTPQMTEQRQQSLERELLGFLAPASYDNNPLEHKVALSAGGLLNNPQPTEAYLAYRKGSLSAVIVPATAEGYEGPIQLWVAVATEGHLLNSQIIAHRETPNIGDKILPKKTPWLAQFNGQPHILPNEVDHIAGATRTSRAVAHALANSLAFVQTHHALWPSHAPD